MVDYHTEVSSQREGRGTRHRSLRSTKVKRKENETPVVSGEESSKPLFVAPTVTDRRWTLAKPATTSSWRYFGTSTPATSRARVCATERGVVRRRRRSKRGAEKRVGGCRGDRAGATPTRRLPGAGCFGMTRAFGASTARGSFGSRGFQGLESSRSVSSAWASQTWWSNCKGGGDCASIFNPWMEKCCQA